MRRLLFIVSLPVVIFFMSYFLAGFVASYLGYRIVYAFGPSMSPTMYDSVCVLKRISPSELKRGDIVSLISPDGTKIIKRIVGMPGEQIQIKNNAVYINGQILDEPYLPPGTLTDGYTDKVIRIPSGCIYVLGDNRANSSDSREFGPVSLEQVTGKVVFCLNGSAEKMMLVESILSQVVVDIARAVGANSR